MIPKHTPEQRVQYEALDRKGQADYDQLRRNGESHERALDRAQVRTRQHGGGMNCIQPDPRPESVARRNGW